MKLNKFSQVESGLFPLQARDISLYTLIFIFVWFSLSFARVSSKKRAGEKLDDYKTKCGVGLIALEPPTFDSHPTPHIHPFTHLGRQFKLICSAPGSTMFHLLINYSLVRPAVGALMIHLQMLLGLPQILFFFFMLTLLQNSLSDSQ